MDKMKNEIITDYKQRMIDPLYNHGTLENGVRLYDEILVEYVFSRPRKMILNRRSYQFLLSGRKNDRSNTVLYLDSCLKINAEFELVLCSALTDKNNENNFRFLLRAKGNYPFQLNGSSCYEAYLERGDKVVIENNKIIFLGGKPAKQEENISNEVTELIYSKAFLKTEIHTIIEGETGTGKTSLALKIHNLKNSRGEFVHINLANYSLNLIESELFGHVKGAFTGAVNDKTGAFYQARNGTLFIDEVDSLPLEIQTKLLLFLDNQKIRPVGGVVDKHINTYLIIATGRSAKVLQKSNDMRKDFYYRIFSGIQIKLPSLKEKPGLVKQFIMKYCDENNCKASKDLINLYCNYYWPGNYRQLKFHLRKKALFSESKSLVPDKYDLELSGEETADNILLGNKLYNMEKMKIEYVSKVYKLCNENIKRTSEILEVAPNTVRNIIFRT
jgi:hypothetical protein